MKTERSFAEIVGYLKAYHPRVHTWLNRLMLLYAFLLPLSGAFSTHTGPWLLLLLWLLEGGFPDKLRPFKTEKALLFFFALVAWIGLSTLWSDNKAESLHILSYYLAMSAVLVSFLTSLDPAYRKRTLYAFFLGMFVSEIASYGIFFEWWQFGRGTPDNPSPFMHHIKYSIFLSVTVFLLLGQILDRQTPRWLKTAETLMLLSVIVNLFINGGRTGQLALVIAGLLFTALHFGFRYRYLFAATGILIAILTAAYFTSPVFHKKMDDSLIEIQQMRKGDFGTSWGLRLGMKAISWDIVKTHPLVGVGAGDALDAYKKHWAETPFKKYALLGRMPHVHDQYLEILLQTGFIGLFLMLGFLLNIFKRPYEPPTARAVAYAALTVMLFSFFTEVTFRNNTSVLFAFLLGYFWSRQPSTHTKPE